MKSLLVRYQNLIAFISYAIILSLSSIKAGTTEPDHEHATKAPHVGLYTVDYIIIGVASTAVAASLGLLIAVILTNRKKSKNAIKVDPNHGQAVVRTYETEPLGVVSKSSSLFDENPTS